MKSRITVLLALLLTVCGVGAESYDLTRPMPVYDEAKGYGFDIVDAPNLTGRKPVSEPFYFSVKVPDGNYRVTVTLGSRKYAGETVVRAESRRMMTGKCLTRKGEYKTLTFNVHKRTPEIEGGGKVRIKKGEIGSMTWDEKLTLEFNGAAPAVRSVEIERDTTAVTFFLCGNSTVVDQGKEPWASWGQMVPRWLTDRVCVANYGESGLTATSFMAQGRLDKILSMIKTGDYVFCEFGHNDEKEKGPGTGAWYHYTVALKKFVDRVREKGGKLIFCTPTQRRFFEKDGTLRNTHGEFPEAMRAVAQREEVPLIDLNKETKTLFEAMGSEGSKHLLVHYPMGSFPWQDKVFADNTHFNPFGAYEVAKIIVMGMKRNGLLADGWLSSDWQDFNPAQPDDWQTFYWPLSPLFDGTKPDGN